MRYTVTTLDGWPDTDARTPFPGVSAMVVDTLACRRVVATFRSEDYGGTVTRRRSIAIHCAERTAARLNGQPDPPAPSPFTSGSFRPVCPYCGRRCADDERVCRCGRLIYESDTDSVCRNGHARTEATTYYRPNGSRECLTCKRERKTRRAPRDT